VRARTCGNNDFGISRRTAHDLLNGLTGLHIYWAPTTVAIVAPSLGKYSWQAQGKSCVLHQVGLREHHRVVGLALKLQRTAGTNDVVVDVSTIMERSEYL
jgi:hypothetical protein